MPTVPTPNPVRPSSQTIYDANPHLQALVYEVQAAETAALRANAMCLHAVAQWEAERADLTRQLDSQRDLIDELHQEQVRSAIAAEKLLANLVALLPPAAIEGLRTAEPGLRGAWACWHRYYGTTQPEGQ